MPPGGSDRLNHGQAHRPILTGNPLGADLAPRGRFFAGLLIPRTKHELMAAGSPPLPLDLHYLFSRWQGVFLS